MNDAFFQPLNGPVTTSPHICPCPEFSDHDWLRLGIQRVLERVESGRAFLQEHGPRFDYQPTRADYFVALQSERRRDLARDVNQRLIATAELPDRLASIPELATYECFALDGRWHQAASHDPRHEGRKMAVGHFYSLNLRGHQLRHWAVGEALHEHDLSVLQRLKPTGLRHQVPKGKRVLIVYDKAGIDFTFWQRCQRECAVYFLSRVKEGMVFDWIASRPIDHRDPRQRGVREDRWVVTREGRSMRIIVIKEIPGSAGGFPEFDSSGSRFGFLRVNRSKHTRKETENGKHRLRESETHEMGMQISGGVHPEVPEEAAVSRTEETLGWGVPRLGPAEGVPD